MIHITPKHSLMVWLLESQVTGRWGQNQGKDPWHQNNPPTISGKKMPGAEPQSLKVMIKWWYSDTVVSSLTKNMINIDKWMINGFCQKSWPPWSFTTRPHLGFFVLALALLALLALAWRHRTSPLAQLHGAPEESDNPEIPKCYGNQWESMGINGNQWESMGINGNQWSFSGVFVTFIISNVYTV